jgi:hypothetical protein
MLLYAHVARHGATGGPHNIFLRALPKYVIVDSIGFNARHKSTAGDNSKTNAGNISSPPEHSIVHLTDRTARLYINKSSIVAIRSIQIFCHGAICLNAYSRSFLACSSYVSALRKPCGAEIQRTVSLNLPGPGSPVRCSRLEAGHSIKGVSLLSHTSILRDMEDCITTIGASNQRPSRAASSNKPTSSMA